MNYLVHSYFSGENTDIAIGNFIGDFVKGDISALSYGEDIKSGLLLHRAIDSFSDSNKHFLISKHRLDKRFGLFRGIMVDIFYDHFLAKNWNDYSELALEAFTSDLYQTIESKIDILPLRFQQLFPSIKADDWLTSYRELSYIGKVLERFSKHRLKGKHDLSAGIADLQSHYQEIEGDFTAFMRLMSERFAARS
ncbi:acyl carrier protein phosphodiesterase [Dongshaea marina]|uniref:acyl carrier protein phosphodiesterase n=1 Tax=Dongshaea marina TaxID=2047966 RepID=UPI000D3E2ADB|nr:acyl carrier protein phosphodiesterase [Dongshaea marina]